MRFAYRDYDGNVTECSNLGEAVSMLAEKQNGMICKLSRAGRWYGTTLEQIQKDVRRKVAQHTLMRLLKQGYSEKGSKDHITSTDALYYGGWPLIRCMVLGRDGHTCRLCSKTAELEVHHILPKCKGGADNPVNLITLCRNCHVLAHRVHRINDLRIHRTQTRLEAYL